MSPVLNHPTAEWFCAYFICISLSTKADGQMAPKSEEVETGRQKINRRNKSDSCDDYFQRFAFD